MGRRGSLRVLVVVGVVFASLVGLQLPGFGFGVGTHESVDLSYGTAGIASISTAPSTDERVGDLVMDGSDRAVIAGTRGPLFGGELTVTRLTTSGALDTGFGAGGIRAIPSAGGPAEARSALVAADGSIVAGGTVNNGGQLYLARLTSNGTIDSSFGSNGSVLEPVGSIMGIARALAQGSGGSIVAVGNSPANPDVDGYIARFTSVGVLDPTFDGDGRLPVMGVGFAGVLIQPDNKIVAVGDDFRVMRFNVDGTPDSTFGTGGTANVPHDDFATGAFDVVRNNDGSLLVAGSTRSRSPSGTNDFRVIKVTASGTLDTTFGSSGFAGVDFLDLAEGGPGDEDQARDIHLLPDGRFVVAGWAGGSDSAAARFLPDGRLDTTFGQGGRFDFGGSSLGQHNTGCCSAVQSDGAVVLASTSDAESIYHQYNYHPLLLRVPGEGNTPGWFFEAVDGPNSPALFPADVGSGASSTLFGGQPHVFSHDATHGDLRHAWYDRGWHAETLDGASTGPSGRINANVGVNTSTLIYGGQLHVFYDNRTSGSLRHAWWTGAQWSFETLDGTTNALAAGHIADDVGGTVATNLYESQLHAYYYDRTHGDLRHAWWNGAHWTAESLDGNVASSTGRITSDVGQDIALTLYAGAPHVWYQDTSNGDLRHGWWTGTQWRFETLDGNATNPATGQLNSNLGSASSVAVYAGAPHVWYHDTSNGDLRHGWWTGTQWRFETLDGRGGTQGRTTANVGTSTAVMLFHATPHVWYRDVTSGNLRHAWWDGKRWDFEPLDGFSGPAGRVADDVATGITVISSASQAHVWYHDETAGDLRHAWYG